MSYALNAQKVENCDPFWFFLTYYLWI